MSLFRDLLGSARMKDPVRGVAQVVSTTAHHGDGVWQNCRMNLVVQGEGVEATAVEHSELVRASRWPAPGMVLPVTVDRKDPHRLKVEWDEVGSSRDRSRDTAEGMAAAMRGEPGGAGGGPSAAGGAAIGGAQVVNLSGRDLSKLTEEQKAKLRMLGVDPDALAAQQAAGSPGGAPAPASDNPVDERLARLEKLGQLRDQGLLTDVELEQQKRQILES